MITEIVVVYFSQWLNEWLDGSEQFSNVSKCIWDSQEEEKHDGLMTSEAMDWGEKNVNGKRKSVYNEYSGMPTVSNGLW